MSVEQIQDRLLQNAGIIAQTEKALALNHSVAIESSLRSLYKLRNVYEDEFRAAASVELSDVVSYRIFDGLATPTMALVGKALDYFQTLYSVVYAAAAGAKAKSTTHLSPEIIAETSFRFGYAYSGSLGFVFTLPNEMLLFESTKLDAAMTEVFQLATASGTEQLRQLKGRVGLAPIRALYKWLTALTSGGVGIDIKWERDKSNKGRVVLQPAEIRQLKAWIDSTSESESSEYDVQGILIGYDSAMHSFRFDPHDGASFRGVVATNAEVPARPVINQSYGARIKSVTRIHYATEVPDVNHELLKLS